MAWQWLSWLRRDRKEAHRALFDMEQAAVVEERAVEALKDLAEVGKEKIKLLAEVAEFAREYEGGDEYLEEASRAYREGLAALASTPLGLLPADRAARLGAMSVPSSGSTASQPAAAAGLPDGPGLKALPGGVDPPGPGGTDQTQAGGEVDGPPRRPRGRPKGSRNKPKPRPRPGGQDDAAT
jgi:hypothetical protein